MKIIKLTGNELIKDLAVISHELKGDLTLNGGCSYITISNEFGSGTITGIRVSHEISALLFNINFNQNVSLVYSNKNKEFIDMFFCLQGSLHHKLNKERKFETINFRQNTIVNRLKSSNNTISFIPNTPLKMSFISYSPTVTEGSGVQEKYNLREMASNALHKISDTKDYRYLGRICFRTSNYMQKIMSFSFDNTSEILFKEAAILNTLASQLERYHSDINGEFASAPIKQYELDKILALEQFISNNLTENLSICKLESISGLGSIKLQKGFNYLFNKSVNVFIVEKRLEKAAQLLEQGNLNISEIVYSIGFTSRSYFSKIFKNRYGVSPSLALKNAVC